MKKKYVANRHDLNFPKYVKLDNPKNSFICFCLQKVDMPRYSFKAQVIRLMEKYKGERDRQALLRNLLLEDELIDSSNEGSFDSKELSDNSFEDMLDMAVNKALEEAKTRRYLLPRKPYRDGEAKRFFEADLREDNAPDGTPPWLSNEEFREKYRMSRESFRKLVEMIRGHHQFQHFYGKRNQAPVEYQLMVFLFYIGGQASGASNPKIRNMFRLGRGTAEVYKRRCNMAIRSLRDIALFWPDKEERIEIARRIHAEYRFLNCIAVADGTLFPLNSKPQSDDAQDYHGRKFAYSLSVMIINDDAKRIRYYLSGFPGCAHDNRVYCHTDLFRYPQKYFGRHFYLLGDSAFQNSPTVVAAFKTPQGTTLTPCQESFNTEMGRLRVTSEHTIGILKARFPFLRCIPMVITNKKKSVRRILQYVDCCIILHNLLIESDEEDDPQEWLELDDDVSEIGAAVG